LIEDESRGIFSDTAVLYSFAPKFTLKMPRLFYTDLKAKKKKKKERPAF